jgi:acetyl esterase/lipase
MLPQAAPAIESKVPVDRADAITNDSGPYKFKVEYGQRRTISGAKRSYTLYVPQPSSALPPPPFPVVVFLHGFLMSGTQHSKHAEYLAERGVAVFLPNLTRVLWGDKNRQKNVKDVIDQIKWLRRQAKSKGSPLYGVIDPDRLGIAGNSSGGAVCLELLIRAQKANIAVESMCSMDGVPWDRSWTEMPNVKPVHILSLRAEPSICNEHARILQFLNRAPFPFDDVKIIGAHHCDAENPTTLRCMCICGRSREKFRLLFQEVTYLYFRDTLDSANVGSPTGSFLDTVKNLEKSGQAVCQLNARHPPTISQLEQQSESKAN